MGGWLILSQRGSHPLCRTTLLGRSLCNLCLGDLFRQFPGARAGAGETDPMPAHNGGFNPDEECFSVGVTSLVHGALGILKGVKR